MSIKIKKGDEVEIIAGKDRGQRGKVLQVLPKKNRVIVEELNMIKKHQKQAQNQEGGILDKEAPLHVSNVMVIDPSDDKPCRIGYEVKDGVKNRVSRRTKTVLD